MGLAALRDAWPDDDRRDDALQRLLLRVLEQRGNGAGGADDVTPSQLRYLYAASIGLDWNHAADLYGVSRETVRTELYRARLCLAAKNTTHAVSTAIRCHLIP
jgi:hypothetical protein